MEDQKILKRCDVAKENTWALEDIFATDEKWFEELKNLEDYVEKIISYKGKLGQNADSLYDFMQMSDELSVRLDMLANYAMRKNDEDQANAFYIDMRSKLMTLYTQISSAFSFSSPEIIAIPEDTLQEFYKQKSELELYRRALDKERIMKDHVLTDSEEKILAAAGEMASAAEDINSVFTNADIKFPSVKDSNGKEYTLTQGTYVNILHYADRELRKNAFETFYGVFDDFKNTIAATLDAQMKKLKFYTNVRKFNSTIEASLSRNEVPEEVYYNLIDTVHANMDKMYKYIRLRKKLMGVDELHMYDIYCPIVSDLDKKITFEEAKENVLKALAVLGDDYVKTIKEGFDNRWIDVYENEGKRGGAYSAGGRPHPYVLLNHKDDINSQFTLVHEMGHAMHSYLSIKNQPVVYADYVIFVAEVASTCNEVLLMNYLLDNATDKKERAYLINYFLEQFRTTLYRQTMFAEFELDMNKMIQNGEALTAEALNKRYYELNKLYYGDDIVVDDKIKLEWSRIPHFFYNYYVFQYATGFSAAVAIANKILKEGKCAVDNYIKFLSSGAVMDPISLLKIAGVDMASPEPINEALSLFDKLIDEFEELLK